ncbi:MAG: tRNA uridine-5-carboxymethylaminomethyl(34) synthesis GTPase MnmE [Desulforegulaceae bacterium]|nr:tRNA uridine-5-carboxymethylaminomethyl(34) synthesis GTPase MnmE [Desulforegulaceae bacterium]
MINSFSNNNTIAAISTPPGNGGIGIIRVSGFNAFDIGLSLFKRKADKKFLSLKMEALKYRYLYHGFIIDPHLEFVIDEVLIVFMKSPYSYTREDIVEIHSHSGKFVLDKILSLVLNSGSEPAAPGEFTKRAFLNGRIDLTKAESVMDIINSSSEASHRIAASLSSGELKEKIIEARNKLIDIEANIIAFVDFPDDIDEYFDHSLFLKTINEIKKEIGSLILNYDNCHQVRDGYKITIAGPPNAGKSSLLNKLISKERAIVTSIPGTTRDIIEEALNLDGFPLVLSDTAGIRETDNEIEKIGVLKSRELLEKSDLIIFLIDGSEPFYPETDKLFQEIKNYPFILVVNKIDLFGKDVSRGTFLTEKNQPLYISAKENKGIDELKNKIVHYFGKNFTSSDSYLVPNKRQYSVLKKLNSKVSLISSSVNDNYDIELISYDLKTCIDLCSEIIGELVSPDILDRVFSNFCIGK